MNKHISMGAFILLFILFLFNIDVAQASISKTVSKNSYQILQLTEDSIKGNPTYEYTVYKDLKLHLSLSKELFEKPTGIFFDSLEISKKFSKPKDGYAYYVSDFNLKPGKHTLVVDRQTIDISASYIFDTQKYFHDIKNTWQSRSEKFATLTKNGILLKNHDREYGSFAFKRFYSDNLTASFEFVPTNFKPGMAVYFGDNIYFMINNNYIFTMKKNEDKKRDTLIQKSPIPRIENGQLQNLEIQRESNTYTVILNRKIVVTHRDNKELKNQRFRNIGISIPKYGSEILIKKIIIK